MKKILVFNIPEDETEFRMANNGVPAHSVLFDLYSYLRGKVKHADTKKRNDTEVYQEIKDLMHSLEEEYGVSHD